MDALCLPSLCMLRFTALFSASPISLPAVGSNCYRFDGKTMTDAVKFDVENFTPYSPTVHSLDQSLNKFSLTCYNTLVNNEPHDVQ